MRYLREEIRKIILHDELEQLYIKDVQTINTLQSENIKLKRMSIIL